MELCLFDSVGSAEGRANSWRDYAYDLVSLQNMPDIPPLIERNGVGVFWRENIYMISGLAGSMKSYLCLAIAAAAINDGQNEESTLGFKATENGLKVLFVDTELAENTVKSRASLFLALAGNHYSTERFAYLSLRKVLAGKDVKSTLLRDACEELRPDLIVIDSVRDLCNDFNDVREAESIVSDLRSLATAYHAVLLTTSHQSLSLKNAKGHLGMRLNEACALELSLSKSPDGGPHYVSVSFGKERDGSYDGFKFQLDSENNLIKEYGLTDSFPEGRKQLRKAIFLIQEVMLPKESLTNKEITDRMMAKGVSRRSAQNYISVLSGNILCQVGDLYHYADLNDNSQQDCQQC